MQPGESEKLAPADPQGHAWTAKPEYGYSDPPPYSPPGPVYPAYPSVVVNTQPAPVTIRMRPKDYLCWSILNCLFCCWPVGLAAIIFSCKTQSEADRNNIEGAESSSRTAFRLNVASLILGAIVYVIFLVTRFAK